MSGQAEKKKLRKSKPFVMANDQIQLEQQPVSQIVQPQAFIQQPPFYAYSMNPMMAAIQMPQPVYMPAPAPLQSAPAKPMVQANVDGNKPAKAKQALKPNSKPFDSSKQDQGKKQEAQDYFTGFEQITKDSPIGVESYAKHYMQYDGRDHTLQAQINDDQGEDDYDYQSEMFQEFLKQHPEARQQIDQDQGGQEFMDLYNQVDELMDEFDEQADFVKSLKDCTCCKGYVNRCKGAICKQLGQCQCRAREEMEEQAVQHFIPECKDCTCCKGYVYTCLGEKCKKQQSCFCFEEATSEIKGD